jgi:hypothetical protein
MYIGVHSKVEDTAAQTITLLQRTQGDEQINMENS